MHGESDNSDGGSSASPGTALRGSTDQGGTVENSNRWDSEDFGESVTSQAASSSMPFAISVSSSHSTEDRAVPADMATAAATSPYALKGRHKQPESWKEYSHGNWKSLTSEQQAEWIAENTPTPKPKPRGRKRKIPLLWMEENSILNTEERWASLDVEEQRRLSDEYKAKEVERWKGIASEKRKSSSSGTAGQKPKRKLGRPAGKTPVAGPAKTVAASTNAEKRQKIKNLFRKVASVDLCTDVENSTPDDPSTKFVLIQVSTAPAPPVEGGGPHRKVVAEKVKSVTIYGGPTEEDLKRTLDHASIAMSGGKPEDYKVSKLHNTREVEEHFRKIEEQRKIDAKPRSS